MSEKKRIPKVWLSRPGEKKIEQGRKIELRYIDPSSGKEVRKSTGTLVESEALDQQKILEAQLLLGLNPKKQRSNAEWIAKIVSRIGEKSGVVVRARTNGNEFKFVSSHDLRRSCGNRLALAGVPEREIAKVLRHADVETTRRFYAPGTVQESAGIIRAKLTVPGNSETVGST